MKLAFCAISVAVLATSGLAQQLQWVQSPINGHMYAVSPSLMNWTDGEALANTYGGHLATVRSQTEQDWIVAQFEPVSISQHGFWIGLNDELVEGQFVWSSGEPVVYTNWQPGEPNNMLGVEDWAHMEKLKGWLWNDAPNNPGMQALIEVSGPVNYCTAKVNSVGCTPSIGSAGMPTLSGADDFFITAADVLNNKPGVMIWSHAPNNVPFMGGILCVAPPISRTPHQHSGGNPPPLDCSGTYSYHFSQAYMASKFIVPGMILYAQYWSRDTGYAPPENVGLTDGLKFHVWP